MPDSHAGLPDRTGEEGRYGAPAQPRQGPQDGVLCHKCPLWFELEFTLNSGDWREKERESGLMP